MKKTVFYAASVLILTIVALQWTACDKGSDEECTTSYDAKMKAIIDAKCLSCHSAGGSAEDKGIYASYDLMKPNFAKAWERVDKGEMPPAGNQQLTNAEKDDWECWKNASYAK